MKYLLFLITGLFVGLNAYNQGCSVNYTEPTFQLKRTDLNCSPNTGIIEVFNQQNGVGPFTYTLVEASITNSTGLFTGLAAGLYTVELRDACGTVRTRQVTLVPWSFSFQYTVDKTDDCSNGKVTIKTLPEGSNFLYGVVISPGDTIWSALPEIDLKLQKKLAIIVKDECGNSQSQYWNAPHQFIPYIDVLQYRLQCDKFDLFPAYWGFDDPEVCLYEFGTNKLIECKTAPGVYTGGYLTNFFDIPWGQYYVIVQDKCFRDSMFHPDMRSSGGSELNPYNWDCTTFTMHVDGMEDTVCLYDGYTNQLISCKGQDTTSINPRTGLPWPSGAVWENLPYGNYYAWIYDPCMDSTFRIDSTVAYPFSTYIASLAGCSLGQTTVLVNFNPESKKPYGVAVYNTNGTLNSTFTSLLPDNYFGVTVDSSSGPLMVIGSDACGISDTAFVTPQITQLSKSIYINNKCPGISGTGGSGDVEIWATTGSSTEPRPQIIKKNGIDTTIAYSFNTGPLFVFPNLESGLYVIRYTFTNCSRMVLYDTVVVQDYIYPTQNPLSTIQCGGNIFNFTFPVLGGLNPYTFQIIDNTPVYPSLITPPQSSPSFTVGTGQHYTNVKVRAIDRCGNSTIGDVAVLPINGCSTLAVDSFDKDPSIRNKLARVYPNPSKDHFIISFSQKKKTNYRIEVLNAAGAKVFERSFYNIDQKNIIVTERLLPGMYFINIIDTTTGKTSVFKQVVNQY